MLANTAPKQTLQDPFRDATGRPLALIGVGVYSASTMLTELAIKCGFETVWIEMEHGSVDFKHVEHLCLATEASGGYSTVRVADAQRAHILHALEMGARIVIVPMIDTAEQAREIVKYGKYPPLGSRGYNTRTRGVNYGLQDCLTSFADANARTHLFAQIESMEAVDSLDAICAVEGLSGIFIGPGDLSMSAGCTGEFHNPNLISLVTDCVQRARLAGKHAGILIGPGPLLDAAIAAGCDLIFCGGDVTDLIGAWKHLLASIETKVNSR